MKIYIMENKADTRKLDKTGSLKTHDILECQLKEDTSIFTPIIKIGGNLKMLKYMSTTNYCFIPDLERYYFITDIKLCANKTLELSCRCDVLFSNLVAIKTKKCLIDRQEDWSKCDKMAFDDRFPIYADKSVQFDEWNTSGMARKFSKQNNGLNVVLTVTGGV